ncbi:MAG: twin-arginine translocase subunit TatC [Gemmatimonadota bacterium]
MARSAGEMPFLDHLEELRSRLIKAIVALIVCVALGLFVVDRFKVVQLLEAPILPYLPAGTKLVVHGPTDAVMIWLQMGLVVGIVLASPFILWQLWAFLAPALYDREKKVLVPSLFVGLVLFLAGGISAFIWLVPRALGVLMSFQSGSFTMLITFERYFSFVLQVVLAMGLSAELPLLIILLAALGIVTTAMLNRFRRYAIVLAFVAGAFLSPGTEIFSQLMMTAPLIILYEVGVLGSYVIQRRRLKNSAGAAASGLLLLLVAGTVRAQQPTPPRPPSPLRGGLQDTTRKLARPIDSASARRLGLPTAPAQSFAQPDSVVQQLLDLDGYEVTRYRADSATVLNLDRKVTLEGHAMTERAGSTLEAGEIVYREGDCRFEAHHDPKLFQGGTVVVGENVNYNTCQNRGVVVDGLTSFPQQGANWFIRGNLAVDSSSTRLYATAKEITSCDLPMSHYHFSAKELKWVGKSTMVARPAVLYIRDVPVAWIPFLFQDTKQGRRSGILIPEFGFNDLVRPSRGYKRTVQNIGYYWAPNDYLDLMARMDWYSGRYLKLGGDLHYKWINKFVTGEISYSRNTQLDAGGGLENHIVWRHLQSFNVTTKLNVDFNYSSNATIQKRNSIDPRAVTQQIRSSGNFSKQFVWGNLQAGGSRAQNVNDNSVVQALTLAISPKPIDIGRSVTWSPNFSYSRNSNLNQIAAPFAVLGGILGDSVRPRTNANNTSVQFDTPIRIGSFNLQLNSVLHDTDSTGRHQVVVKVPNLSTADPNDSVFVTQVRSGGFGSDFDWNVGFNLPLLLRTSWKVQPSLNIQNSGGGAFAIRNARTNGRFVTQGKRPSFGLSAAPTFFGFLPGFGPIEKIRHSIQPSFSFNYAPAWNIPEEYVRAVTGPGQQLLLRSLASQTASVTLNQNFEAKHKRAPGDTAATAQQRKFRLLSISTGAISYDFEQAKQPGRTGWTTSILSNSFQSDLVPGLQFSIAHDLWDGPVGTDSARFRPFLQSYNAGFSLTSGTFRSLAALLGLVAKEDPKDRSRAQLPIPGAAPSPFGTQPQFGSVPQSPAFASNQQFQRGSKGFNASINLTASRFRPPRDPAIPRQKNTSSANLNMSFSPTQFWNLNWSTQYNFTASQFEQQALNLTRDLHDWRATFSFYKSPNSNFSFSFLITLIDLPELKFDYRQSTIQP